MPGQARELVIDRIEYCLLNPKFISITFRIFRQITNVQKERIKKDLGLRIISDELVDLLDLFSQIQTIWTHIFRKLDRASRLFWSLVSSLKKLMVSCNVPLRERFRAIS